MAAASWVGSCREQGTLVTARLGLEDRWSTESRVEKGADHSEVDGKGNPEHLRSPEGSHDPDQSNRLTRSVLELEGKGDRPRSEKGAAVSTFGACRVRKSDAGAVSGVSLWSRSVESSSGGESGGRSVRVRRGELPRRSSPTFVDPRRSRGRSTCSVRSSRSRASRPGSSGAGSTPHLAPDAPSPRRRAGTSPRRARDLARPG